MCRQLAMLTCNDLNNAIHYCYPSAHLYKTIYTHEYSLNTTHGPAAGDWYVHVKGEILQQADFVSSTNLSKLTRTFTFKHILRTLNQYTNKQKQLYIQNKI